MGEGGKWRKECSVCRKNYQNYEVKVGLEFIEIFSKLQNFHLRLTSAETYFVC